MTHLYLFWVWFPAQWIWIETMTTVWVWMFTLRFCKLIFLLCIKSEQLLHWMWTPWQLKLYPHSPSFHIQWASTTLVCKCGLNCSLSCSAAPQQKMKCGRRGARSPAVITALKNNKVTWIQWGVSEPRVNWTKSSFVLILSSTIIISSLPVWPQQQYAAGWISWWWHGAYAGGAVAAAAAGPWGVYLPSPECLLSSVGASWWGGSHRLWGSGRTWPGKCGRRGCSPLRWLLPGTLQDSAAASSRHQ